MAKRKEQEKIEIGFVNCLTKPIITSVQNLRQTKVYPKGAALAREIFHRSRAFPKEEMYLLTDQIRRTSGSVCVCLAEAYRKKMQPAHFLAKVTDSDRENSETLGWLAFAVACSCITTEEYDGFKQKKR